MARKIKCDPDTLRALYENRGDEFWDWREAPEKAGIDVTLEALGYSKDRNALWYNEHTGSVETLENLIVAESFTGTRNETEEDKLRELAMVLEHWLPQTLEPNPVVARSLALSEFDAMQQVARYFRRDLEEKPTCEQFVARVYSRGGTLPDGSYTISKPGKVEVDLNDGRVFVFSLASIWKDAKLRNSQMTLAP